MKKKHILIFIHSLSSGGAERVAVNLANSLVIRDWQVTVATIAPKDGDFYDLHPRIKRHSFNLSSDSKGIFRAVINNLNRIISLRHVLLAEKPDIALGIMTTANILLCLASIRLKKIHLIFSEHNYPPTHPLDPIWEYLRRKAYPFADKITVLTIEGLDWLNSHIPKAEGVVMPNAIPYPLPMSKPKVWPGQLIKKNRKILLAAGRLVQHKGFDLLLQAFAKSTPVSQCWELVILGEGELRPVLEKQIESLFLAEIVHLPGVVGNISDWYNQADIFILSSRTEGFGLTLVEAMSYGCAVVSFDCDAGPRSIIRHKVDGLLIPAGDIMGLVTALDLLMNNQSLRLHLAESALNVRERFSEEKILAKWECLLHDMMQSN